MANNIHGPHKIHDVVNASLGICIPAREVVDGEEVVLGPGMPGKVGLGDEHPPATTLWLETVL